MAAAGNENVDLDTVHFTTVDCSRASYEQFLRDVIAILPLAHHLQFRYLPALPLDDIRNYFFVQLSNGAGHSIKLVLQKSNLYVVAYQTLANDRVWYFEDTTYNFMKMIFPDREDEVVKVIPLNFRASYSSLTGKANVAGRDRKNFALNVHKFAESISSLYHMTSKVEEKEVGKGFLSFVQIIFESLRLRRFCDRVANIFEPNEYNVYLVEYFPTSFDVMCQNQWGNLSKYVLAKNQMENDLERPVTLVAARRNGVVVTVQQAFRVLQILNSRS